MAQLFSFLKENPYAAFVLLMMVLTYLLNQFDRYMFSVSKIPFIDYSGSEYGALAGPYFTLIYTISGVALGFLGEVNRKNILCFALVFWSVATGLVATTTAFWQVALLRVAQGIGEAGCTPFATSIIGEYFPAEMRAAALGCYNSGIYLGYGMALAIGTVMLDDLGWAAGYIIFGLIGCGVAVLMFFTVKEPERAHKEEVPEAVEGESKWDAAMAKLKRVLAFWRGSPSLLLLCLAGGVRNAGGYVWGSYTAIFFAPLYETYDDQSGTCHLSYDPLAASNVCTSDYPYCIAGECSDLSDTPWHNEGISHDKFEAFMSWIPLVAGTLGALLGGLVSDRLVKLGGGPLSRVMVIMVSNILASPFGVAALYAPYPWCFLSLLGSNILGEMWIGVTLALVLELVPGHMRVTSVALYLFIITNIGGNMPLAVPYLQSAFDEEHTFHVQADDGEVDVTVNGSVGLQTALLWLFPGVYLASSGFFLVAYVFLRKDIERAKEAEDSQAPLLGTDRSASLNVDTQGGADP